MENTPSDASGVPCKQFCTGITEMMRNSMIAEPLSYDPAIEAKLNLFIDGMEGAVLDRSVIENAVNEIAGIVINESLLYDFDVDIMKWNFKKLLPYDLKKPFESLATNKVENYFTF